MPNVITLTYQYGFNSGTANGSSLDITVTAQMLDDTIDVDDAVTVSDVSAIVNAPTGINGGDTVYYYGSGTAGSNFGYFFGTSPMLPASGSFIFATDGGFAADTRDALRAFAADTTTITLGMGEALCFAAGTQISTPCGDVMVEDLKIGDVVLTTSGAEVPVKRIGRQTISKLRHGPARQPVRIRAGALGPGVPQADLVVTADHGMLIDGYVINASALVNNDTIDYVPTDELEDSFTVYHVETEFHDVILANGAPAETFIDVAGREAFDNYQEYLDLYGAERIIPEMAAPRISTARLLPEAVKRRLGRGAETANHDMQGSALARA